MNVGILISSTYTGGMEKQMAYWTSGLINKEHNVFVYTTSSNLLLTSRKRVNLDKIASKMVGYTGADIEGVVREAAILALRENDEAKEVTSKHFDAALEEVTPSVTEDTVKYYAELGKKLRSRNVRKKKRSEDDLYM